MTRSVRLRSLAKINLDLRVLNKRADGFHDLRTVFQTISLADTMEIEYEPARRTTLALEDALAIPDNLVLRAARVVLDSLKVHASVHFRLRKNIPMGGGLGGGSSNAAAVLLALPVLAGRAVPFDKLAGLGGALGSDVPFFLNGGTAVGVDRGTEIYNLPDVNPEFMLVVASGIHVATGAAYQALGRADSLTSVVLSRKLSDFQHFVRALGELRSANAASAVGANDFESAVFDRHPHLKTMWSRLRKYAAGARMTGSGSALFAVFGSKIERDAAQKSLERDRVFAGDGVSKACRVIPASTVSGRGYRRLWRAQLAEHLAPVNEGRNESIWPPRSRYAR